MKSTAGIYCFYMFYFFMFYLKCKVDNKETTSRLNASDESKDWILFSEFWELGKSLSRNLMLWGRGGRSAK